MRARQVAWIRRASDGGWLAVVLMPAGSANGQSSVTMQLWLEPRDYNRPHARRLTANATKLHAVDVGAKTRNHPLEGVAECEDGQFPHPTGYRLGGRQLNAVSLAARIRCAESGE